MLQISQIYSDYLKRRAREWMIKVDIDGVEYDMSQIVDINISNEIADGYEGFTIGTANISSCTLQLRTADAIPPNAKVVPYVAMSLAGMTWDTADYAWDEADFAWDGSSTTEWLPLGTFYVDNRDQKNMIWTFECYDGLTFADIAYVSQLDYPASMQDVWDEVCTQAGLAYDSTVQIDPAHTLNAGPAGYTCRQVLSYIAGCHGASVKMSRYGEISWRTYTADETPDYEMTEADYMGVKQTNPVKTYTRVVVTYDEDDGLYYEAGEGDDNHTLYLTNPLMTQAMTDTLLAQISGFAYMPIEMDARGYPQLEHGDRIAYDRSESMSWLDADIAWDEADFAWDGVETYQTLILEQTFSFRGGLGMSLTAPSVSEQESEFGIDGSLTAAVNRLNRNAVRYGKPYYGVTHSRDEGIVVQREDGSAKAVFNADELSFYKGGQKALYFDVPNDRYVFNGHLQAASGTFTGELQGGTIAIGSGNNIFRAGEQGIWAGHNNFDNAPFRVNMSGEMTALSGTFGGTLQAAGGTFTGELVAASGTFSGNLSAAGGTFTGTLQGVDGTFSGTITAGQFVGGTITGALIQTSASSYPRVEIRSDAQMIRAASGPNNSIEILAYYAGFPYVRFDDGLDVADLWMQSNFFQLGAGKEIRIQSGDAISIVPSADLYLTPLGGNVRVQDWSRIYNNSTGRTLLQDLAGGGGGFSGGIFVDSGGSTLVLDFENGLLVNVQYAGL